MREAAQAKKTDKGGRNMQDNQKLSKAMAKPYRIMFLAALGVMLLYAASVCTGTLRADSGVRETIQYMIDTEMQNSAEHTYTLPQTGLDLSGVAREWGNELTLYMMLGLALLFLALRHIAVADSSAKEFQQSLPVKGHSVVMHTYRVFAGMITAMVLLFGVVCSVYQAYYDHVWVEIAGGSAPAGFYGIPAASLWTYLIFCAMAILLLFTWVYLGMTLTKNPLAGILLSVGTWFGTSWVYDLVSWDLMKRLCGLPKDEMLMTAEDWAKWDLAQKISDFLEEGLLNPAEGFWNYEVRGFMRGTYGEDLPLALYFGALVILLLAEIGLIRLIAEKRTLTGGGRLFYFRKAEYAAAIFYGVLWLSVLGDFCVDFSEGFVFAVFTGIVIWLEVLLLVPAEGFHKTVDYRLTRRQITGRTKPSGSMAGQEIPGKTRTSGSMTGQFSRVWHTQWKRCLVFTVSGIMAAYLVINDVFYHTADAVDFNSLPDQSKALVLDSFLGGIFEWCHLYLILPLLLVLTGSKLMGYWQEWLAPVREFTGSLPLKRHMQYWGSVLADLCIMLLPLMLAEGKLFRKVNAVTASWQIKLPWLADSMAGIVLADLAYTVMLVGLLHIMEELFSSGIARPLGFWSSLLCIKVSIQSLLEAFHNLPVIERLYGYLTMEGGFVKLRAWNITEYEHALAPVPILYQGEHIDFLSVNGKTGIWLSALYSFSDPSSYMGYVLTYLAIGAVLLALGVHMAKKKDLSRNGLNFRFGKYLLAALYAGTFFCMTQPYAVAGWHRALLAAAAILAFYLLVWGMTPAGERHRGSRPAST